jgi:heat shock protein HslJ
MRPVLLLLPLALAACGGRMQPAQLAGSSWQLVELRSGAESRRVEQPARYTMAFDQPDEVSLQLDCNRGRGRAEVTPTGFSGGRVAFGAIATTRAMCPPGSLDTQVARGLSGTLLYTLEGDTLRLSGPGGAQQVWRRAAE